MAEKDEKKVNDTRVSKNKKSSPQRRKTTKTDTIKRESEQARTTKGKKAMVEAMGNALGVVTTASKLSGISRSQHYQWMSVDKEYQKEINDVSEMAKDFVESSLFGQIRKGNTTATIFYMKCKMRERGYIEKVDVDLNTNRPDLSDMTTEEIKLYLNNDKK